MHQKDTMGRMDKTMDQSNHMMKNMDMMMGKRTDHGCMGMMMHNMSRNMVDMMEHMESMMDNPEMDPAPGPEGNAVLRGSAAGSLIPAGGREIRTAP